MFDNDDEIVQRALPVGENITCRCAVCRTGKRTLTGLTDRPSEESCKWRRLHWDYMSCHGLDAATVPGTFKKYFPDAHLPSLWQTHMCYIIVKQHIVEKRPLPMVWDISQSIGRNGCKANDAPIGCITSDPYLPW